MKNCGVVGASMNTVVSTLRDSGRSKGVGNIVLNSPVDEDETDLGHRFEEGISLANLP